MEFRKMTRDEYRQAFEKAQKRPGLHPSRAKFVAYEIERVKPRAKPTALARYVVSLRLCGLMPAQIGKLIGKSPMQVREILKPWGVEVTDTFWWAWPEYLPHLDIPDWIPQESPDHRKLVAEAKRELCRERKMPDARTRKRGAKRR